MATTPRSAIATRVALQARNTPRPSPRPHDFNGSIPSNMVPAVIADIMSVAAEQSAQSE